MGTVQWSELLRWVPREPKADSEQEFQAPDRCEAAAPVDRAGLSACEAAQSERAKPTLASL